MKEILPGSVKLTDEPGKDFCCKTLAVFVQADGRPACFLTRACARVCEYLRCKGRLRRRMRCLLSRPPLQRTHSTDEAQMLAAAFHASAHYVCLASISHTFRGARPLICLGGYVRTGHGSPLSMVSSKRGQSHKPSFMRPIQDAAAYCCTSSVIYLTPVACSIHPPACTVAMKQRSTISFKVLRRTRSGLLHLLLVRNNPVYYSSYTHKKRSMDRQRAQARA